MAEFKPKFIDQLVELLGRSRRDIMPILQAVQH